MAALAQHHDLAVYLIHTLVRRHDLALQLRHNGTCRIDDVYAQLGSPPEGRGGLAVCADEETAAAQRRHVGIGHRAQPQMLQTQHLHAVVHDVAQREDLAAILLERRLGLGDGANHTEAESRIAVYLNIHTPFRINIHPPGCHAARYLLHASS